MEVRCGYRKSCSTTSQQVLQLAKARTTTDEAIEDGDKLRTVVVVLMVILMSLSRSSAGEGPVKLALWDAPRSKNLANVGNGTSSIDFKSSTTTIHSATENLKP